MKVYAPGIRIGHYEIAGRPLWWFVLYFIPLVNIIVGIIVSIDVAKKFGKGVGFGIGIALLGFIFIPILGFSDATYDASAKGMEIPSVPGTQESGE